MIDYYLPSVCDYNYVDGIIAESFCRGVNARILGQGMVLLLDYCSQKYLSREAEEYGIPLNSNRLLRNMINSRHASRVVECLQERNILQLRRNYCVGRHSKIYQFCNWVLEGGFVKHSDPAIKKPSFYARSSDYDTQELLRSSNILVRSTVRNLLTLQVPEPTHVAPGALSKAEKCCRRYALERFHDRRMYCFLDRFGRLHSNFTNLPKDLRILTLHEGKPIYYVDIKSCFPTLLWTLVHHEREKAKYRDWIMSGQFYENLMRRAGIDIGLRSIFKKEFNAWINGGHQPDVYHAMRSEFPALFSTICAMKRKEYRNVGYSLMRLEAEIMLNDALTRFWDTSPHAFAISLHDAIYATEQSCTQLEGLIKDAFEAHVGIMPCIETVLNAPDQNILPLAA